MGQAVKGDDILIAEFLGGQSQSFEELLSRYSTKVFNLAYRLTKNHEDAEEVLQDVFTTVFKKVDRFQGKSAFSSWIYRITVNSSFMKLRKRRRARTVFLEDVNPSYKETWIADDDESNSALEQTFRREIRELLDRNIKSLPDDYRGVFVLRDIDGFTNREVGKLLGISTPAVKSRLHRARTLLRRRIKSHLNQARQRAESLEAAEVEAWPFDCAQD